MYRSIIASNRELTPAVDLRRMHYIFIAAEETFKAMSGSIAYRWAIKIIQNYVATFFRMTIYSRISQCMKRC